MKPLLLLFALFSSILAFDAVKGEVKILTLQKAPASLTVRFANKTLPVLTIAGKRVILLPVGYKESAKTKKVVLKKGDKTLKTVTLHVKEGDYASERITVAAGKVHPDKKAQERISREYREAMRIYDTVTPKLYATKPFILPIDSPITSLFGTARIFNGALKSYHSGTDFRATVGTPIVVSNDGVVVLAKERFYAGKSVVVDHGYGIYSCYYHLSRIDVKVGERVKQGEQIALSGKTGRVSGPHLHYAFMVLGTQVNPLRFHDAFNALF